MITRENIINIHNEFIELGKQDSYKELIENRYKSIGAKNFKFESYKQLKDFFDYDINEIQGIDTLEDSHREFIKKYILDFINKQPIGKRYLNLIYKVERQENKFRLYALGLCSFDSSDPHNYIDTIEYTDKNTINR
ncbi:Uncharacterised protein [[Clostridium] sordellii]|uniref:Uncharacterized protein n=2 Tax=Paraclostridium sordellii TaxID=1505 RepID=A0ABM9RTK4_PARSO|nr:hypothetical protein [Paeniclostridium sordellii]EPZ62111.1 hypothetical protein H477_5696 [[Clostridium] sordellii ATCC 9714] [Paeniclostridium sordellii ATCC 9714]CEJ75414.1 hypothetical protein ATCC9714_PCS200071 (plasmid) [[Clostridium] sordellii] [Paeniclostridium sordellii]CEO20759.1 Uncharacterised protein [[Clostridium] sordellii] [Paeniclostridium sordellii]CEP65177.1 Uncharacterised protein [[Clostridium] sordellii] [Paeniclostridium sordellii]